MSELTEQQERVYGFLVSHLQREQRMPTCREIAERFEFRSHNAARDHLQALVRKGWLEQEGGRYKVAGGAVLFRADAV